MKKKIIVANWKLYKTPAETREFLAEFLPMISGYTSDDIVICPPFVDIYAAVEATRSVEPKIGVGAQNVSPRHACALTGEVSAPMLRASGCTHVIIGHSERRRFFGETDDSVNAKLRASLAAGLVSIVCVGEVIQEREAGLMQEVLRRQVMRGFMEISGADARAIVIAYEPVWAIGTGHTATPQLASEAHGFIRSEVAKVIGDKAAHNLRILYGGSVKPENAQALMAEAEIDGALVGSASLDPKSFAAIVKHGAATGKEGTCASELLPITAGSG
jgi:triosephosphate isomerase (TIM)